jgi:hypothetical protein
MPALSDGTIRQALKRVEKSHKQETLSDGEGRGTGRLVLFLRPMPKRVLAEWMAQQWRDGRRTKSKIGSYPTLSLADARTIFQRDFSEAILKRRSIKVAPDARPGTVADLFEAYVQSLKAASKASWSDVEQTLGRAANILGRNLLARDISPQDVLGVLRPIFERGKPAMADHLRSYIRSAYSWGLKSELDYRSTSPRRFKLVSNPAADIPTEPKVAGTRWLNEDEFIQLYRWLECPDAPVHPPYTRAVCILMLTGQRVEEIAQLHVDQWDAQERIIDWVEDQERPPACHSCSGTCSRPYRVHHSERIRLVLPFRKGSLKAGERRHAL